jgi:hypothetical protein
MLELKIQAAKREAEAAEWCEDRTWIFCDATLNAKNAIILPRQARDKHTWGKHSINRCGVFRSQGCGKKSLYRRVDRS